MLHITNGESVDIHGTGLPGEVICWADVLHEGPVDAALPLPDLSRQRASWLAAIGCGSEETIRFHLEERNSALARYRDHEETILWFEHDLYDQLQLIQVLDWFLCHERAGVKLSLISIGEFPGIERFKGLGQLTATQLGTLFEKREEVTIAHLKLASQAWLAFCSADPTDLEWLLSRLPSTLPFLDGSLRRHLEQFPSVSNGLSRSERQIMEVLRERPLPFDDLFRADQEKEERVFMGDIIFRYYLERIRTCRIPLVESSQDTFRLTPAGEAVLGGAEDAIRLNGIDRWLGGVHLAGDDAKWRWHEPTRRLLRKETAGEDRN